MLKIHCKNASSEASFLRRSSESHATLDHWLIY